MLRAVQYFDISICILRHRENRKSISSDILILDRFLVILVMYEQHSFLTIFQYELHSIFSDFPILHQNSELAYP